MLKLIFRSLLKLPRSIGKFITTHILNYFSDKKPFSILNLLTLFYNSFKVSFLYKLIISLHSIFLFLFLFLIIVAIIIVFYFL